MKIFTNRNIFLFYATLTALLSSILILIFFMLPNTPINHFEAVNKLPVKYLGMILIGGLSKDFMLGWFTCTYYYKWKAEKQ